MGGCHLQERQRGGVKRLDDVRRLLDAGVRVYAEEPRLAAHGLDGEGRLLDRVRPLPADEAATRWSTYRMVCFL
ncbi:hypothetical protein [Streptomyces javensis]|uniref:Uncharacterized protein n=1 Tax=Streptomyces javensis TaxID=114698 RepID=A0ABS0R3R2_9ACTN|nr:hypothetical protein [Streptomyces javensis]MBI0312036.1 hypothetical protein [Streptomyces javensis]